jgi:ATP-dependent 26S proteasome regulatory subunit
MDGCVSSFNPKAATLQNILSGFVFVLATTTTLRALDPTILRPGRLETHIHVQYPDVKVKPCFI